MTRQQRATGILAAFALVATMVLPGEMSATTVVAMTTAQVVAASQLSVLGTVVETRTFNATRSPGQFTGYRVAVEESWASAEGDVNEVWLLIPGGEFAGGRTIVEGMPALPLGGRFVLFLERQPKIVEGIEGWIPVGLEQGVWRPTTDGRWRPSPQGGLIGGDGPLESLFLDELRDLISAPRVRP